MCIEEKQALFLNILKNFENLIKRKICKKSVLMNWVGTKMNKNIIMRMLHEKMELFHSKSATDNFYAGNNMTYFVPFFFIVELPELIIAVVASAIIIIELILTAKFIGLICIVYVAIHMVICV